MKRDLLIKVLIKVLKIVPKKRDVPKKVLILVPKKDHLRMNVALDS